MDEVFEFIKDTLIKKYGEERVSKINGEDYTLGVDDDNDTYFVTIQTQSEILRFFEIQKSYHR